MVIMQLLWQFKLPTPQQSPQITAAGEAAAASIALHAVLLCL
jgi:hypothetical protein